MKNERYKLAKEPSSKKRKEAIEDFEYMRNMAEAKAYMKLSQERPLTPAEFAKYKAVCAELGIKI